MLKFIHQFGNGRTPLEDHVDECAICTHHLVLSKNGHCGMPIGTTNKISTMENTNLEVQINICDLQKQNLLGWTNAVMKQYYDHGPSRVVLMRT